jgi:hypothetical protein
MSSILFKKVDYTLRKLIEDIDIGEIGLPEIQRPFVWPNTKVRDLFDSMFRGYPIGYILLWANGLPNGHRQIGGNEKQKVPHLLIVDGQQRLTSLYAVLKGIPVLRENYQTDKIVIAFNPLECKFEVCDASIRRNPEYIADISEIWNNESTHIRFIKAFIKNLRQSREISEEEEDFISENIDQLYDLHNYPFTAMELSASVGEESVAEVFVRINSKGTPLNQADFILTLMSVFWDEGRKQLEFFCRDARRPSEDGSPSPFNYHIHPDPDELLRTSVAYGFRRARLQYVYNILRGKDLRTEKFSEEERIRQFGVLQGAQAKMLDLTNWHDFLKTIRSAGFTSQLMVASKTALLYNYAFYLIGKYDYQVDHKSLREVIARWFFMTSLSRRYTGSQETIMEEDLRRLDNVNSSEGFINTLENIMADNLTDDFWNIHVPNNELFTSSSRSPALLAFYAAQIILGAKALFSNLLISDLLNPAISTVRSNVERHHLFPKGFLQILNLTNIKDTNQVANMTFVEWMDNAGIKDSSPTVYYPEYKGRYSDTDLRKMLYWHALPDDWESLSYEQFLIERRRLMAQVIRDGFDAIAGD